MATREPTPQQLLDAVLRSDPASFTRKVFNTVSPGTPFEPNWHVGAIMHQLERVQRGEVKRLLITMPPRMLKSISGSVAFPAYLLGRDPTKRIVCVSYGEDLAEKHARDSRAVMESDWYRRIFPKTRISREKSAGLDFETTRRGGRLSTSAGGSLTGRGGTLIIIDDPQKPTDAMSPAKRASTLDWYQNTVSSRLDDKRTGAIIVVMQRLHVEDLAGHLLEQGGWTHLNLPAIATEERGAFVMPKPGTRLIREWRGVTHAVLVHADGFEWQGERHRSLSLIARAITGAHWSGPRFFGLRRAMKQKAQWGAPERTAEKAGEDVRGGADERD